ncbi:AAA family ATPase [Roseicella sp. DB1501]|uniref:AAA family ATPase n=1 Tax=Roseicella sp. DB1501 TaxID=2730925 RepID=UPI0014922816|nr:AAA family ATPase [Roseicella sp. DB1501]NOG73932.1 AAA family ATPase [Roseicella sp. DB1501]
MTSPGFRLRHLIFLGPVKEPAAAKFGPGLNVIYGASDTGKSFIAEAIDFMLGGKLPLRDIPERIGYDRVLLGIETIDGTEFTLQRSADGGRFRVFDGLHTKPPTDNKATRELSDQHSDKNRDNLSMFLLEQCGLAGMRVRRNNRGATNSLSFRNLARLMIVTETEITSQRSPLKDGNPTADTPNYATFKLLLTGTDDSALSESKPATPEDQSREAQLELLDQLAEEYRDRLKELTKEPKELDSQLSRLEDALKQHTEQLTTTESQYRELANRRRELRSKLEEGNDRRVEIDGLKQRFALLAQHYESDIARLRGIEEAGTMFVVLGQAPCPLCGADPMHRHRDAECSGDVSGVIAAARSEIAKVDLLRRELDETVAVLNREAVAFDRRLPRLQEELGRISEQVDRLISPRLTKLRASYAELADKRGEVREALAIWRSLQDIERRREMIDNEPEAKAASVSDGDLPTAAADEFAARIEKILQAWHFPEADRVFFDTKSRDIVISGKLRTARGKGLRAITHAAFTLGLLDYCRAKGTPHPGFVVLDSPLLAYRPPEGSEDQAPEGAEDDLRGTDLNEQFYAYLEALPTDRQVIIIENTTPPPAVLGRPQVEFFSRNPHSGRFGFFPLHGVGSGSPSLEETNRDRE